MMRTNSFDPFFENWMKKFLMQGSESTVFPENSSTRTETIDREVIERIEQIFKENEECC